MSTLGSGNHYFEVQEVAAISDVGVASAFGLALGDVVVSIHCGSRGLDHQIRTEFLREMALGAPVHGIALPDLELACARSAPRLANAISAPCARVLIARLPTARH
jgi:tRNA-splicing ligase RtcB